MKKNILLLDKWLLLALLFIFLPFNIDFSAPATASAAANDTSLVIQPSKIEITANQDQKISRTFSVINRSNFEVRLKLVVKDYKQISDDGKLEFYDASEESASSWLIPQFLEIGLKPLSTKDIGFVVSVPKNFSGGGHYGAILFESTDSSNTGINSSNFGELVLLTVTGSDIKTSAVAKTLDFGSGAIQNSSPVDFSFKVQNTGNTHFTTQGKVVLKSWLGKEIGNFDVGQLIVYPGTTRVFKWRWSDAPSFGLFRANLMLSDPYTTASQKLKLVDGKWFAIFPWQAGLAILAIMIVLFGAIKFQKSVSAKKISKWVSDAPKKSIKVKIKDLTEIGSDFFDSKVKKHFE